MASFRRILFWAHLVCGVSASVVILIMCVTGVALTYQKQMQLWVDTRDFRAAPPVSAARLPVAKLIDSALTLDPEATPTTVTFRADPSMPAAVALGMKTVFVNPYTAEVYGEGRGQATRTFFSKMTAWHRYLGTTTGTARATGRAMTGAGNLIFLFIVLSGMYLWWPKALTWAQIRNVTWFRRGLMPKAREFNWHNVIGFWSAIPLAVVVYSGVVISYPWAGNMVYRVAGEAPPAPVAGRGAGPAQGRGEGSRAEGVSASGGQGAGAPQPETDLDARVAAAMAVHPDWKLVTLRVPTSSRAPLVFTIDRGEGGQPQLRSTVTMNARTGAIEREEGFDAMTRGRRWRSWLRFAHTGEYFGLTGQTMAGLVSAGGAVLVYTGLMLALRRFAQWRKRRAPA